MYEPIVMVKQVWQLMQKVMQKQKNKVEMWQVQSHFFMFLILFLLLELHQLLELLYMLEQPQQLGYPNW